MMNAASMKRGRGLSMRPILPTILCFAAATAEVFYVDPKLGRDHGRCGNGPLEGACKSLRYTKDTLVRSSTASGGVEVRLAAGLHPLDGRPLVFSPEDSGSPDAPIRYVGPASEEAVLSGAVEVSPASWALVSDSDPTLFQSTLPVSDTVYFHQLFVNGTRRDRSRSATFAYDEAASDGSYLEVSDSVLAALPDLSDLDGVYCVTYESWTASYHEISHVDLDARRLYLAQSFNSEWAAASGNRFYIDGAARTEGHDVAGNFHYDRANRLLTYRTADDAETAAFASGTAAVSYPQLIEVLVAEGTPDDTVHDLLFQNLVVEGAAVDMSDCLSGSCDGQSASFLSTAAVRVASAVNVAFEGITVRGVGGYGVWFSTACDNVTLSRSHLHDLGAGGARLGPAASGVEPDVNAQNRGSGISDCVIEDGGLWFEMGCGVLAQQVNGAIIEHNTISNFGCKFISFFAHRACLHNSNNPFRLLDRHGDQRGLDLGVRGDIRVRQPRGVQRHQLHWQRHSE